MKNPISLCTLLSAYILFSAMPVSAADEDERHHNAHPHGQAKLNIVLDQGELFVALETPAVNILGFEHAPNTTTQQAVLKQANITLSDSQNVVQVTGGDCKLMAQDIDMPFTDKHQENSEVEHDDHEDHEGHTDVHAEYTFKCANESLVKSLNVSVFKHFGAFKGIDTVWVIGIHQRKLHLTPDATKIELR